MFLAVAVRVHPRIKRDDNLAEIVESILFNQLRHVSTKEKSVYQFHSLTHLSEATRTFFPKSSGFLTPLPTPKGCGSPRKPTNDSEQPISRWESVWSISRRAQSERFRRAQKKAEH